MNWTWREMRNQSESRITLRVQEHAGEVCYGQNTEKGGREADSRLPLAGIKSRGEEAPGTPRNGDGREESGGSGVR